MPAFVIGHPREVPEELLPKLLLMPREPHHRVPRQIDGIELHVRQIMQHVRIQRHPQLLMRRNLLRRDLQSKTPTNRSTKFLNETRNKNALTYENGFWGAS